MKKQMLHNVADYYFFTYLVFYYSDKNRDENFLQKKALLLNEELNLLNNAMHICFRCKFLQLTCKKLYYLGTICCWLVTSIVVVTRFHDVAIHRNYIIDEVSCVFNLTL